MDEEARDRATNGSVAESGARDHNKETVARKDRHHNQKKNEEKLEGTERMKMGLRHFLKDLTTPRLIVLKSIYFCLLAGVVILWPQFTVHQGALGLTVAHTGICSAVASGLNIVTPFLSGVLGDKMGNYRIMLIITTLLVAVAAFLFSVVPSARVPTTDTYYTISTITNITTTDPTVTFTTTIDSTSSSPSVDMVDDALLPLTFWTYLAVRTSYGVLQAVSYTLYESAVMAEVQATGVDYGFQRAWGTLAVLVSSFLSGFLVEKTAGFNVIFYVSAALQVMASALMLLLSLEFKLPATCLTKDILKQIARVEVVMFFAAMLTAGIFFGFLETYMYRYLTSLGASPMLVGITVTVGAPFEMVLTLLASFLVPLLGHVPIIIFGLFAHAVRLLGFSLLVNPWWVIPFEILESVSNGLLSTVGVMYCTVLFSLESIASFRGIFAVVYFGVGQLIGAASGSWLQAALGERRAFRALAAAAVVCGIAYSAAYCVFKRYRKQAGASTEYEVNTTGPLPVVSYLGGKKRGFDNEAWVADE